MNNWLWKKFKFVRFLYMWKKTTLKDSYDVHYSKTWLRNTINGK